MNLTPKNVSQVGCEPALSAEEKRRIKDAFSLDHAPSADDHWKIARTKRAARNRLIRWLTNAISAHRSAIYRLQNAIDCLNDHNTIQEKLESTRRNQL